MNYVPEPTQVEPSYTCDPQRRIDFKKYLQEQEILKAKMEKKNKRSMLQNVDIVSLTRKKEEDLFEDENMSLEEDYFDDETDDEETSR